MSTWNINATNGIFTGIKTWCVNRTDLNLCGGYYEGGGGMSGEVA